MSSSCLGRTYALDLEIIKSPPTSTSSSSSTLSDAINSPLAISTRKPRSPRKRPNQTYSEAAALLSTAYPYIFPAKTFAKPPKFTLPPPPSSLFPDSSSQLLLFPFRHLHHSGFLLHHQSPIREKPSSLIDSKADTTSWASQTSSGEVNSHGGGDSMETDYFNTEFQDDFDAESIILDEETEQGIDSIMGNLSVNQDTWDDESNGRCRFTHLGSRYTNPIPMAMGLRKGIGALRHVDQGNCWNFSTVDVLQISPKTNPTITTTSRADKKKRKNKAEKPIAAAETPNPKPNNTGLKLKLKLNYENVVNAWSDGASPFSEKPPADDDVYARLAQVELLSEGEAEAEAEAEGGGRKASVLRYKQKRHTRLLSTKIRYQVRKVNADRRPRIKGRFVRRPSSSTASEER
ncbi:hypothetical protein ERO13_D05G002600v2 [Gossypium hirsutum]|nr:protein CHLOROPLAST IMPORT APPARATUS 2-like isoform X2 [Gossypium hirsutum]XP_040948880.1 protein CHLOROPLAST IMPORT APPARATUS 2-like isoform X2 [Gossypium hirsutum]KAG4143922.1 hypothetical protein ERO13_D05G002600v2 [Gossypium hirsutum]